MSTWNIRQDPAPTIRVTTPGGSLAVVNSDNGVTLTAETPTQHVLQVPGEVVTLTVITGVPGAPGRDGIDGDHYQHDQPTPSAEWIVNHNFGYRPNVSAYSIGGNELWAQVLHTSDNQARIYFDFPTAGYAVCS